MKISLTVIVILLLVAFVGILTQHGHDTIISRLSLAPLLSYLLFWGIMEGINAIRK